MTKVKVLTSAEAAALRGTTQRQIQRLAAAGVLPVYQRGLRGVLLFKASDVRRTPLSLA